MVTTRLYRNGRLEAEDFPLADVSEHTASGDTTVWADLLSPTPDDLAAIADELGFHALAVEDAALAFERPKLDRYESHLFLTAYATSADPETGELTTNEVKAFVTRNAIVTVHGPEFDMAPVVARWDEEGELATHGVAFLLWGLLDHLVDSHFDTVQQLDGQIEDLEDALFDDRPCEQEVQRRSFQLRKSLVLLRRVVLPMREVAGALQRRDAASIDPAMQPYIQDLYDHVLRVTEWTESLRDLVTTILETNVSIQGNRMNLIMKKVTSWAAIIAVPTAITGFFGQNLAFPGFGTVWGLVLSSALILLVGGALYASFRRRDWL